MELSPQGRVLGRIRPAGQRCGTLLRLAKRLPKRRECRTVQNHRLIELVDQTLEHLGGNTLPGLALDPRWNLGQGIQSVEVTANTHECVERDQNWASECTERILQEGVRLTLIVESRGEKRAQLRTVQGRHVSIRPRRSGRGKREVTNPFFASSTPRSSGSTRTTRRNGNQWQRPGGWSNFADRLGMHEGIPPVEALHQINTSVSIRENAPKTRHAVHARANDVPFLIISFRLRNPSRFCMSWFQVRTGQGRNGNAVSWCEYA